MEGRQPPVVRARSHRLVDLRRQDDFVAATIALHPAADDLFRDPVALLHVGRLRPAVDISRVEEVDARLDRGVHDRAAELSSSAVKPNRIVPRPMLLTRSPERPRWAYVISPLTAGKRTRSLRGQPENRDCRVRQFGNVPRVG